MANTSALHAEDTGSIPVSSTDELIGWGHKWDNDGASVFKVYMEYWCRTTSIGLVFCGKFRTVFYNTASHHERAYEKARLETRRAPIV